MAKQYPAKKEDSIKPVKMGKKRASKKRKALEKKAIVILIIAAVAMLFLRLYNANELSGGDDSEWAMFGSYALQNKTAILFPKMPNLPISYSGVSYPRPVTLSVYAASIAVFGHNRYAIVMPGVLFSIGSLFLLYYILKRMFSIDIAVLSSLLFAFSPFLLAFTRIGLLHAQLIFFSLSAILLTIKSYETKKKSYLYLGSLFWLFNAFTTELRGLVLITAIAPLVAADLTNAYNSIKREKTKNRKANDTENVPKESKITEQLAGGPKINRLFYCIRKSEFTRHWILSILIISSIYILYLIIPAIAFGNSGFIKDFIEMFIHAIGKRQGTKYLPLGRAIIEIGKYIFFTPFAGFIFVPMATGIIIAIRNLRQLRIRIWLAYLAPIALFYLQGQFSPDRQLIFLPAFCVFAAIALVKLLRISKSRSLSEKAILYYSSITIGASLLYIAIMIGAFPEAFSYDYKAISSRLPGWLSIAAEIFFSSYGKVAIGIAAFFLAATITAAGMLNRNKDKKESKEKKKSINDKDNEGYKEKQLSANRKAGYKKPVPASRFALRAAIERISFYFVLFIVLINLLFSVFAVCFNIGIYKRPDEVAILAEYIRDNLENESFSCIAGIHDKSFTFYTGRFCAFYLLANLSWIKEKAENNELKYFVINLHYNAGTVGLGKFLENGTIDLTNNNTGIWRKNYLDKYFWIKNNTIDITEKTGLKKNNSYFRLYEYRGS